MDATTFDQLIKRLATTRVTRLTVLRGLAAGGVAALTGMSLTREEAGAKKNRDEKEIRICTCASSDAASCRTQKKAKTKAKKTLRRNPCAYRGRCSGVSGCAASGPGGTCSDGIKNGTETDVDCGGSCPRCPNGKACLVANDCIGGACTGGQCGPCTPLQLCGSDENGLCQCDEAYPSGEPVCDTGPALAAVAGGCANCPAGTETCVALEFFYCYKRCGPTTAAPIPPVLRCLNHLDCPSRLCQDNVCVFGNECQTRSDCREPFNNTCGGGFCMNL